MQDAIKHLRALTSSSPGALPDSDSNLPSFCVQSFCSFGLTHA